MKGAGAVVSKPMLIVAALFVATIASALVGYAYYHSYRSVVASLEEPPTLEGVLSRVTSLRYTMTYYNGTTWIVLVNVDSPHRRVNITLMSGNGTTLAYYLIGYSGDQIIYAQRVDPHTGNRTSLDIAKIDTAFRTSASIETTPTGETGVVPFPGIGPLYALYTITKVLSINWLNPTSGNMRVGWEPTTYKLGHETLRAVRVEVVPQATVAPPSPYGLLTRLTAVAANYKGLIIFPEIRYEAGETSLTITLSSIHVGP
ncbi:MAG: hypothetical protein GSR80_001094 [Desulfurococcales archaeon]|nr:hypothetical protein [Desulfurococcales archaeon]